MKTCYYFVIEEENKPPLAMFLDEQKAIQWRNENYPKAMIEEFELILR